MDYQEYIDLGFERIDVSDGEEFRRSGYNGFVLTKQLRKGVTIEVCSDTLGQPRLYIEKKDQDMENFILRLSKDQVLELLT